MLSQGKRGITGEHRRSTPRRIRMFDRRPWPLAGPALALFLIHTGIGVFE